MAAEFFAVMTAAALLLRAAGSSAALTADPGHPAASAWLVPILAGVALAAPLPPLGWGALRRLATVIIRGLAAPAIALLALYLAAHSGLINRAAGAVHLLLLGYYWATLGFTGVCLCAFMARICRVAIMPGIGRLRSALLLVGAGSPSRPARASLAPCRPRLTRGRSHCLAPWQPSPPPRSPSAATCAPPSHASPGAHLTPDVAPS